MSYPTHFSSVPTPGINNEHSLNTERCAVYETEAIEKCYLLLKFQDFSLAIICHFLAEWQLFLYFKNIFLFAKISTRNSNFQYSFSLIYIQRLGSSISAQNSEKLFWLQRIMGLYHRSYRSSLQRVQ
jgi:hypothetical protein